MIAPFIAFFPSILLPLSMYRVKLVVFCTNLAPLSLLLLLLLALFPSMLFSFQEILVKKYVIDLFFYNLSTVSIRGKERERDREGTGRIREENESFFKLYKIGPFPTIP